METNSSVPPTMPAEWHVAVGGQQAGPFTILQIQQMISENKINAASLAWKQGMSGWLPLSQIPDLAGFLATNQARTPASVQAQQMLGDGVKVAQDAFTKGQEIPIIKWYLKALKNYAVFSGRARRKEFGAFTLITTVVFIMLAVIDYCTGTFSVNNRVGLLTGIYLLTTIVPTLAVTVRRLHDIDCPGWVVLLSVIP